MAATKQGLQEAWRTYLELALGVTEASKKKAQKVAKQLAGKGGATAQQLQTFADNLVSTGLSNREALTRLVRFEVDRALGVVGLATAEEVEQLNTRVRELERQLRATTQQPPAAGVPATAAPAAPAAKQTVAKRTVAKKAVAKKTAPAAAPAPAADTVKKAAPRRTAAKRTVPPKAATPSSGAAASTAGATTP